MIRTAILASVLLAAPAVQAQSPDAMCMAIGELAASAMQGRQAGVPPEEIEMALLDALSASRSLLELPVDQQRRIVDYSRDAPHKAYSVDMQETEEKKASMAQAFGALSWNECHLGTLTGAP